MTLSHYVLSLAILFWPDGRYVHSPNVRLRALRALTASESETSMQSDNMDESCGPSDGSARSRISQFSVLAIARDMTELLTKINKSLIPILESVLSKTHRNPPGQCIIPLPSDNYGKLGHEHGYKNSGVILTLSADNSFPLESYAIRLVGKLIRTISSERKTRSLLINLLGSVALDSRWKMDSFGKSDVEHGNLHERRLQGSVRLVAVRELEKCLAAPFGDLLQVHEIVPVVIELLCFILISCTAPIDDVNVEFSTEWHYERTVVAFAALVPLCRLRICPDGSKLALLSNSQIAKYIPVFLLSILGRHGSSGDYGHISQLSPFIIVNGTGSASGQNAGSKMTVLSFEPIVSSITTALGSARRARDQVKVEICTLLQILSSLCFHALTSYLYSGFQLDDIELFEDFIFSSGIEASSESAQELLGRSKTLAALTESTIARYSNQKAVPGVKEGDKAAHSSRVGSLFNLLLYACDSTRHAESIAASRAVIATLPSLICIGAVKVSGKDPITTTFARIASRLQREVVALERIRSAEHASLVIQETASLLAILHDTVNDVKNLVPTDDVLFCFDLCKSIVRGMLHQPPSYCLHLAIRCMVASIDRMPSETAKSLLSDETRWAFELEDDKTVASTPSDCFDLTADFIGRLVSELLVQRMRTHSGAEKSSTTFKIRNHEEMALEVDSMERFEIEESQGASQPSKSVWLCGESLLVSFRIGSSTSRYRGWVEIVIRCPTFRKRELVRLLSKFSVGNPDPSTLWTLNLPSSIKDEKIPLLVRPVHYDTEQVLERYKSLCSRFDLLLPPTSQDDQISAEQTSPVSIAEGSSSPQAKQTHQTGGLIASTANLNVNSPGFSASENVTNRGDQFIGETMYEWLKNALENDDNVKDVLVALHKLNLPDELIHQGTSNDPKALDVDVKTLFPARRLKTGPKLDRAIAVLDRTTPSNTHKVALLYASPFNIDSSEANLESESLLLSMKHCSPAFIRFADGLGNLVATKHLRYFSAGLDVSHYESDGLFTRVWVGNEGSSLPATKSIVVYHAVYLMPEGINNRKRHVGNDNVLILFVEKDSPVAVDVDLSEEESDESVVSGHFGFVTIYVSMLPQPDLARVTVRIRRGLPDALRMELLNFAGNDIIAMHDAPAYVRGLAIRADLACRSVLDNLAPASNCYERYRMLWEMNRYVVK